MTPSFLDNLREIFEEKRKDEDFVLGISRIIGRLATRRHGDVVTNPQILDMFPPLIKEYWKEKRDEMVILELVSCMCNLYAPEPRPLLSDISDTIIEMATHFIPKFPHFFFVAALLNLLSTMKLSIGENDKVGIILSHTVYSRDSEEICKCYY